MSATSKPFSSFLQKAVRIFLYFFFLFLCVEAFLRLQQVFHPLIDLNFPKYDLSLLSYELNHKPGLDEDYNADGVQNNRLRPSSYPNAPKALKVLFMGDSFMHGYPPAQTIPQYVWEDLQQGDFKNQPLLFWNAGYSSYAPLVYIVQAKKLIPKYQPDIIVLDIDETDLVDDFALYKKLVKRDSEGKVAAVWPSYSYESRVKGYVALKRQPSFTIRLFGMWLHKARMYFLFRSYHGKEKAKYYRDPMSDQNAKFSFNLAPGFDRDENAWEIYAPERESFREDLNELMTTLIEQMGDPRKILLLYHPQLYQLTPDPRAFLWRPIVPGLLKEASEKFHIDFYDASQDLKREFGDRPDKFYREWDMHFYPNGMQAYSRFIAAKLQDKLKKYPQP